MVTQNMRVKEDMVCPITTDQCDDECCVVGSICNLSDQSFIAEHYENLWTKIKTIIKRHWCFIFHGERFGISNFQRTSKQGIIKHHFTCKKCGANHIEQWN